MFQMKTKQDIRDSTNELIQVVQYPVQKHESYGDQKSTAAQ